MSATRPQSPQSRGNTHRGLLGAATIVAAAMIAHQVAGKAARDALFLTVFDVTQLPLMVIGAAVTSLGLVVAFSKSMSQAGPWRLVPILFLFSGGLLLVEWILFRVLPRVSTVLFYLHIAALGPVLVSGFWSTINEVFDPRSAKKGVGRIVAGATFGGLLGGVVAERLGTEAGALALIPVLAVLHVFCGWRVFALRPDVLQRVSSVRSEGDSSVAFSDTGVYQPPAWQRDQGAEDGERPGSIRATVADCWTLIRRQQYLRSIAVLVLVTSLPAGLLDYAFKMQAYGAFQGVDREQHLIRFFAVFYALAAVLTFLVQSLGAQRVLSSRFLVDRNRSIAATLVSLPAMVFLGGLGAIFFPGLLTVTLARGGETILRSSIFRSGYEILYVPVSRRDKRSGKVIIDVGIERIGDAVSGGMVMLLLLLPGGLTFFGVLAVAVVCAVFGLRVAGTLQNGYIRALEDRLENRATELDLDDAPDPLTHSIVLRTTRELDISRIRSQIDSHRQDSVGSAPDRSTPVEPSDNPNPPQVEREPLDDPLLRTISTLRSGDIQRTRSALQSQSPLDRRLVPFVVPLLAHDALADDAVRSLRGSGIGVIGQLVDAMLDQEMRVEVRRAVPRVLAALPHDRSIEGLMRGLHDPRFEVRFHCGRALTFLHAFDPRLLPDPKRLEAVILHALSIERPVWEARHPLSPSHRGIDTRDKSRSIDQVVRNRSTRGLDHVFALLGLMLDRKPLQIAYRGLHTDDPQLRGTALEYLESVLPSQVRLSLWPYLGESAAPTAEGRTQEELLDALLRSHQSIMLNLKDTADPAGSEDPD